jgi:hypothetical protein
MSADSRGTILGLRCLPMWWIWLGVGCSEPRVAQWCSDEIASARIAEGSLWRFAILGGGVSGTGLLFATGSDGTECETPVAFEGGQIGAAIDIVDVLFDASLELPQSGVSGAGLFGTYDGTSASSVALLGASTTHLVNGHGVGIDEASPAMGLGFSVAYAWLTMSIYEGDLYAYDSGDSADSE